MDMMEDARALLSADEYTLGTLKRADVYVRFLYGFWLIDWSA